jgi:hypothetical protein
MKYEYYYNNTPEHGLVRNNLVYTSLISEDKKRFVQWFYNDKIYHKDQNQVIDSELMEEKWNREIYFLKLMQKNYPNLVPETDFIDHERKELYLKIDGVDFWQQCLDAEKSFEEVLPDWEGQMLEILQAHKDLGFYKYSLHPSSYFLIDGQLKSINYFFCHDNSEAVHPVQIFQSHISHDRQAKLLEYFEKEGLSWESTLTWTAYQLIALESFRFNYPDSFIDRARQIYVS